MHSKDVPKIKFIDQGFHKLQHEQDRQTETDATERITTAAFSILLRHLSTTTRTTVHYFTYHRTV